MVEKKLPHNGRYMQGYLWPV